MGHSGSRPAGEPENGARREHAASTAPAKNRRAHTHDYLVSRSPADFQTEFVGLIKVKVESADMGVQGHWSVTMSLGLQSFVSKTSSKSSCPVWHAERNFAVLRNESSQLHFVIHKVKRSKLGVLKPSVQGALSMLSSCCSTMFV